MPRAEALALAVCVEVKEWEEQAVALTLPVPAASEAVGLRDALGQWEGVREVVLLLLGVREALGQREALGEAEALPVKEPHPPADAVTGALGVGVVLEQREAEREWVGERVTLVLRVGVSGAVGVGDTEREREGVTEVLAQALTLRVRRPVRVAVPDTQLLGVRVAQALAEGEGEIV